MNYWLTTHWPPRPGDARPVASGVYLPADKREVGQDLREGDLVLVYQALSGRTLVRVEADGTRRRVPCLRGKGGIIAIGRARSALYRDEEAEVEQYADGTAIHWAWYAPLDVLSTSGFVPREEMNGILGYNESYGLRGFGDRNSGLKKLDEATYLRLEATFRGGAPAAPILPIEPRRGGPAGGEGEPHRLLKEYVAGAPALALREAGLVFTRMEHVFPTCDRADVVLTDRYGRIMGVEVEVHVGDEDLEGFLQALKYAAMLEPLYGRALGDSRAVLVAYSVSSGMRSLCTRYGVECIAVAEAEVLAWHLQRVALP